MVIPKDAGPLLEGNSFDSVLDKMSPLVLVVLRFVSNRKWNDHNKNNAPVY